MSHANNASWLCRLGKYTSQSTQLYELSRTKQELTRRTWLIYRRSPQTWDLSHASNLSWLSVVCKYTLSIGSILRVVSYKQLELTSWTWLGYTDKSTQPYDLSHANNVSWLGELRKYRRSISSILRVVSYKQPELTMRTRLVYTDRSYQP
jgi:hypothetical protein